MKKYTASILVAGCLWGLMGIFTRNMSALGFDTSGMIIIRVGIAGALFGLTILLTDPGLFRVKLRHLWCFVGSGICSLLFFTFCYFKAISMASLSVAAVLLYTAPSMVMVISLFVFKEKITGVKTAALLMAFAGCCLVSGVIGGERAASALGIIYGLCSGFGYALYSIFARLALDRGYDSRTINFYSCVLAVAGASVIWGAAEPVKLMFASAENLLWCVSCGVISCYLPYLLYTYGLSGVEAGKASVMASLEPAVATVAGIVVFREKLSFFGLLGIILVLGAIVLLNIKINIKSNEKSQRRL